MMKHADAAAAQALKIAINGKIGHPREGWETGQHYLALLRPECSKAVPVEKLCFLPIELALLRNDKN